MYYTIFFYLLLYFIFILLSNFYSSCIYNYYIYTYFHNFIPWNFNIIFFRKPSLIIRRR